MSTNRWLGASQAITQVTTVQVTAYHAATTYTLTVGTKSVSVIAAGSVNATATALAAAWNASDEPELQEITAEAATDTVTLTADDAGNPFTVSKSTSGGSGTMGSPSTTTAATGPTFWDNIGNWSLGAAPITGTNEVQQIAITGGPGGGSFTVTWNAQTTGSIAYNASAADVQTALEGLSNIDPGDVACAGGALPGTPVTVTFQGQYRYQNVAQMTTTDGLTGGTAPASAVTTTTPGVTGDDVVLENSDVPILHALGQSAITVNSLTIAASYTANVGLPEINEAGYHEYRTTALAISATTVNVGAGAGNGSGMIKLNTGSVQTTLNVYGTGSPSEPDLEAFLWKGSHASNVVNVFGGSVGLAPYANDTATIATLRVTDGAQVRGGAGLSLTTVNMSGGNLEINAGATTISKTGGDLVIKGTGAVTTLTNDDGAVRYLSSGTITTLNVGSKATLDFTGDTRARTITNTVQLYEGGAILDPSGSCSFLAGIKINRCGLGDVSIDIGQNRTVSIA